MRPRRGGAAVEMAILTPVFLLLLAGVLELVLLMHRAYVLDRITMEACRAGVSVMEGLYPTGDLIEQAAIDYAVQALEDVGVPCGDGCLVAAEWEELDDWMVLRVSLAQPWVPLTGIFPKVLKPLYSEAVMLTQQQVLQ